MPLELCGSIDITHNQSSISESAERRNEREDLLRALAQKKLVESPSHISSSAIWPATKPLQTKITPRRLIPILRNVLIQLPQVDDQTPSALRLWHEQRRRSPCGSYYYYCAPSTQPEVGKGQGIRREGKETGSFVVLYGRLQSSGRSQARLGTG